MIAGDTATINSTIIQYNISVQPEKKYMVQLAWLLPRTYPLGDISLTTAIDGVEYPAIAIGQDPVKKYFYVTSNPSGILNVSVYPMASPPYRNPFINTIEVFQITESSVAPLSPSLSPSISPLISPSLSPPPPVPQLKKNDPGFSLWKVLIIGFIITAILAMTAVCLYFYPPHIFKSGKTHKNELVKFESESNVVSGVNDFSDDSEEGIITNESRHSGSFEPIDVRTGSWGVRIFDLEELKEGCNNFSSANIIGRGGFGIVYKTQLRNGQVVAMKKLDDKSTQGTQEFLAEVEILARIHHRHLVNLIGYSNEERQLILVYEYMSNGSLRDILRDETMSEAFTWAMRLQAALGAATGIDYLHRGAFPPVIHRDIKTSNILLDSNFKAQVADFGLSRNVHPVQDMNSGSHIITKVKGTVGYLDPEYYSNQQLTTKADVYSFGVILLELLTGRLPIWCEEGEGDDDDRIVWLVEWAVPYIKSGDTVSIIASYFDIGLSLTSMEHVAVLAQCCVEQTRKARPSMADVVRKLEDAILLNKSSSSPLLVTSEELTSSLPKDTKDDEGRGEQEKKTIDEEPMDHKGQISS